MNKNDYKLKNGVDTDALNLIKSVDKYLKQ